MRREESMSYYTYKDCKLYYETKGQGIPVVLIHGWGIDHRYLEGCMEPVFDALTREFERFYLDLPGMGRSIPGFVRDGDDCLEVLHGFMEDVVGENEILLVGNSFGGLLSMGLAKQWGAMVSGMILLAPATGCKERTLPQSPRRTMDSEFFYSLKKEEQEAFAMCDACLTKEAFKHYQTYIYPAVGDNKDNEFLQHVLKGEIAWDVHKEKNSYQFKKPVLCLVGREDTCVGYQDQFEVLDHYPNATYLLISGAGHNIWVD